jgi:hypothetical protein
METSVSEISPLPQGSPDSRCAEGHEHSTLKEARSIGAKEENGEKWEEE